MCGELTARAVAPAAALRTAPAAAGGLRKWGRRRPQMNYHLSPPPSTRRRCAAAGIELEDYSFSPHSSLFSRGSIRAHRHLYARGGARRRLRRDDQ